VLYEDGLVPALRWLAGDTSKRHGLKVEVVAQNFKLPLDEDVRAMLYESVRELLFNVVKHARVEQAWVTVRIENSNVSIMVSDDGAGMDVGATERRRQAGGLGLFSIRERLQAIGGTVSISSSPGAGMQVTLTMPLDSATGRESDPR